MLPQAERSSGAIARLARGSNDRQSAERFGGAPRQVLPLAQLAALV